MLQSHSTPPVAAPLQGEHDEARGEASALAATMVITLQRFASLVFSATVLSPAYPPAGHLPRGARLRRLPWCAGRQPRGNASVQGPGEEAPLDRVYN